MSAPENSTRSGRRRFLKGVMAVGGTTVLVAVGREAMVDDAVPEQQPVAASDSTPAKKGYRETDHIRTYYEKARI